MECRWKLEIMTYGRGTHNLAMAMNTISAAFLESDIHPESGMMLQMGAGEPRAWGCAQAELPWRFHQARERLGLEGLWQAADEDRPLPNGYKPSWKSIIAASEEEL